ncbi:MAG: sugar ABC transporter substrate-binding protein [candidate division KSB1 bacterium]|nr:sugar ABC transporter substrate-binding protein [candidate division KSB1 bacterium]MDZ7366199.1 sugar ABC transporter substrate-binding protein [candidate division KSB1 bacterium]MDZ7404417.1 sugar ABC transporter substrate-binding protein [candidate division KSB1 bacterium]
MSIRKIQLAFLAGCVAYIALLLRVSQKQSEEALIFSAWGTVEETENLVNLVEIYNAAYPQQKVKFVHLDHREYDRKILIQTAAGNPPDVFLLSSTDLSTLAYRGVLKNLSSFISADTSFHLADFFPALLKTATIRDQVFGIPIGYTPMVMYYNRRLFREAGVHDPDTSWTWNDFLQTAIKLTKREADGRTKQFGCMISMAGYTFVYPFGGHFFDERRQWFQLDQPKTLAALQFYGDLAMKYRVTTSPTEKLFNSDQGFRQEAVAMIAAGRWQVPNFARTKLDWGVAPMPRGEISATGVIVYNLVMSKFSKRQQQAWEFIKFMASPLAQQESVKSGNLIPSRLDVANSPAFLRDTRFQIDNRIFLQGVENARLWPMEIAPETSYLNQLMILNEEMEKAMLGHQSYADAARTAQDRLNAILRNERQQTQGKPFWGSRTSYLIELLLFVTVVMLIFKHHFRLVS